MQQLGSEKAVALVLSMEIDISWAEFVGLAKAVAVNARGQMGFWVSTARDDVTSTSGPRNGSSFRRFTL